MLQVFYKTSYWVRFVLHVIQFASHLFIESLAVNYATLHDQWLQTVKTSSRVLNKVAQIFKELHYL